MSFGAIYFFMLGRSGTPTSVLEKRNFRVITTTSSQFLEDFGRQVAGWTQKIVTLNHDSNDSRKACVQPLPEVVEALS